MAHRTVHPTRKRNFPDIQYPLYILQLVENLMVHVTDHLPHFTIVRVRYEAEGRLGPYRHFIEVLVESSAIYAIPAALYLAFILRNSMGLLYLDSITNVTKVCW